MGAMTEKENDREGDKKGTEKLIERGTEKCIEKGTEKWIERGSEKEIKRRSEKEIKKEKGKKSDGKIGDGVMLLTDIDQTNPKKGHLINGKERDGDMTLASNCH